jgi:hypothetical protein
MRWVVAMGDGDEVGLFSFLSPTLALLVHGCGTESKEGKSDW